MRHFLKCGLDFEETGKSVKNKAIFKSFDGSQFNRYSFQHAPQYVNKKKDQNFIMYTQ